MLTVDDPAILQALCAEVDEQANFQPVGFEVVNGLRQMDIFKCSPRFDLYHHLAFHKKVHAPPTNFLPKDQGNADRYRSFDVDFPASLLGINPGL